MNQFYILANPAYFKKAMGWDMKHGEMKRTEDNLVLFVASDDVPETNIIEPFYCGVCNPTFDIDSFKEIYKPYFDITDDITADLKIYKDREN